MIAHGSLGQMVVVLTKYSVCSSPLWSRQCNVVDMKRAKYHIDFVIVVTQLSVVRTIVERYSFMVKRHKTFGKVASAKYFPQVVLKHLWSDLLPSLDLVKM